MDPLDILKLLAATGLAGVITSFIGELYQRYRKKSKPQETTEDRVQRLTKSLNEATALINNIESEIRARSELATQLQNDLDQYNKLVELKKAGGRSYSSVIAWRAKKRGTFKLLERRHHKFCFLYLRRRGIFGHHAICEVKARSNKALQLTAR